MDSSELPSSTSDKAIVFSEPSLLMCKIGVTMPVMLDCLEDEPRKYIKGLAQRGLNHFHFYSFFFSYFPFCPLFLFLLIFLKKEKSIHPENQDLCWFLGI